MGRPSFAPALPMGKRRKRGKRPTERKGVLFPTVPSIRWRVPEGYGTPTEFLAPTPVNPVGQVAPPRTRKKVFPSPQAGDYP